MISDSQLKLVREIEIKTRHLVQSMISGKYHSRFKGQGIDFSQIRPYEMGDDTRRIDWKVMAKTGKPFIKQYEEERDLQVIVMVDLSASTRFGSTAPKRDIALEMAAVLGFSAILNNDRVGLLTFTDQVQQYIPAKPGKKHMFRMIRDLYSAQVSSKGTDIKSAVSYLLKVLKRRSIVILISDFQDQGYQERLRLLAAKHDLVPIFLSDTRERELPDLGILHLEDLESSETVFIDTSSRSVREQFEAIVLSRDLEKQRFFRRIKQPMIHISTDEPYTPALLRYFRECR